MDPRNHEEGDPSATGFDGVKEVDGLEIRWRLPLEKNGSVHFVYLPGGKRSPDWPADGVNGLPLEPPGVPSRFDATVIDRQAGRRYYLSVAVDDDGAGLVGFAMDTAEGTDPVRTAAAFQEIPFRRLLDESVAAVTRVEGEDLRWRTGMVSRDDVVATRRPRGGRAVVDDERLERVAELHREATAAGDATSKHIARKLGVGPANARRLIMLARRRGFLPPATTTEEA